MWCKFPPVFSRITASRGCEYMRASEGLITSTFSDWMACEVGAYYMQVSVTGTVCRCFSFALLWIMLLTAGVITSNWARIGLCLLYTSHSHAKQTLMGLSLHVTPTIHVCRCYQWRYNKCRQTMSCWVSVMPGRWKAREAQYLFGSKLKAKRSCAMTLQITEWK